ncbi:MAG: hypothetical protein K1Y02_14715 [Candidatus Hydrogenedentes bacterium]|nr:hypothetical protein [Candidatus Hydrogenedentota bacterium]
MDITNREAGTVNDPLYAKSLVLKQGDTALVILTVDAVALGEIGYIKNDFVPTVRARIEAELGIKASNVLINASHCHGVVCTDVADRAFQAVKEASQNLVPVKIGAGSGHEDRIMENRRLRLKNGKEADVRHAYSMPPDDEVAAIGPVDPEIGVLRFDKEDGTTLAAVYNFACHPIIGVPSHGNTADLTGFASSVIEENLSPGTVALFLQGCAGDINPVGYKAVDAPRDAEPLGNMLGLSALRALRSVQPKVDDRLAVLNETITLPRADLSQAIANQEAEQQRLLQSLKGTSLSLKTFLPLAVKYGLSGDYPSYYSHGYLHEEAIGRDGLKKLDEENRANMEQYIANIETMEELTRVQANLDLLRKHQADRVAAGKDTVDVEVLGVRVGDFTLITFPGELTVQIGLSIKKASPHDMTFVAGYTNGYIYYAPTEDQLRNVGGAQEDSDCILGPGWQKVFEDEAAKLLRSL